MPPSPATDALLAELNGDLPPLAPGEVAPIPAESRDRELTIGPAPAPSAVQAANTAHATKHGGRGYRVTVKGEYYAEAASGKGKVVKEYVLEFTLPHLEAALSTIKNKLLMPALKKKFPDCSRVRTNKIVDVKPLSPETPASNNLQYMTREQLGAHVQNIRAPIDLSAYPDVTDLRDAIIDYTQTPSGFESREAARQKDRQGDAELRALNPDIEVGA